LEVTKSRSARSGLFVCAEAYDQNEVGLPSQALCRVVVKYSSRSRWNLSCIALNFATRAAISSRSLVSLRSLSVIPVSLPMFDSLGPNPALICIFDWGAIAESGARHRVAHSRDENLHRCSRKFFNTMRAVDKISAVLVACHPSR